MEPLLSVEDLTMDFGGIRALDQVNLRIHPGEIVALIGPNGAGKTTFFNCLTGMYTPTGGTILLNHQGKGGKRINGLKPNKVTELGLARTFQNIRLFSNMSVLENVMIGRHCRTRSKIFGAIFRDPATLREEEDIIGISFALLERIGLADQANTFAKNLPYGAQRRLEIARALATEPTLLLLDEPAAGMNPQETLELNELIFSIKDDGLSILLIEHDMKMVMALSDHIFVMDYGRKIAEGTPDEVRYNPAVIKAYLGEEDVRA
ncbi:ABC transporter ATP-binding protein [Desulfobulbus rhabdoformis]|jgi:branched-chain amino acid transport system ATP-binding protein|uniref:ABC transporter ATP-binding protein n=1 Tax=Desulfobulbus rhabdoformis TaxID=34032 RepID=UPI001966819A|nr:ABC transporter ATP-binding protein [Desulfobulbus rhabdoformis]MBM9613888.1 ABC transporter ATP-binding protein [Desulfobulbus rhabdoformis]